MLNIIITAVFKLITLLGNLICLPITLIITPFMNALGFTDFITYIYSFLDMALSYASFFIVAFHIPIVPFVILLGLCLTIFTFSISIRAVLLVKNIYTAVKSGDSSK